jgi:hypothetical protein
MTRLTSLTDSPARHRSHSSFFRSSNIPGRPSLAITTSNSQTKEATPDRAWFRAKRPKLDGRDMVTVA